ncbi:MAG: T9SS type A sorting domain-containing protein [Bacteroidota bacterium]
MKTYFWKAFLISCIYFFASANALFSQQYDLRFVNQITSCLTEEIFIDVEIKASSVPEQFNLGIQNYRFNFNTSAVPEINPPIGPPNTNPPDRSVFIQFEGSVSGMVAGSFYGPHTLTGSSGNLVSYNVTLLFGGGFPITFDTWTQVGRLRMSMADPMPPCLTLTWDQGSTLILAQVGGSPVVATAGTFEDITICGICATLPIELSRFDVKEENCNAVLEWETLSETNNSHFVVEVSEDGEMFESIGEVEGVGNSTSVNQYRFTAPLTTKDNYFRLKQVDLNSEVSYSEVKFIEASCNDVFAESGVMSLFPNPVSSGKQFSLRIKTGIEGAGHIRVTDSRGQLVKIYDVEVAEGLNSLELDLPELPNGLYFLQFTSSSWQSSLLKLVISD